MIKQEDRTIQRPQFDVEFEYNEINREGFDAKGFVTVKRLSGGDTLNIISFWGEDRLKNREQFEDVCTTWCDQNAA